jgi:hypothetical protein
MKKQSSVKIHHYRNLPSTFNSIITNPDGSLIQEQFIQNSESSHKVIYNYADRTTVVILEDGTKGVARCNPTDEFDISRGYLIAKYRADIKKMQKRIRELSEGVDINSRVLGYNSALYGKTGAYK